MLADIAVSVILFVLQLSIIIIVGREMIGVGLDKEYSKKCESRINKALILSILVPILTVILFSRLSGNEMSTWIAYGYTYEPDAYIRRIRTIHTYAFPWTFIFINIAVFSTYMEIAIRNVVRAYGFQSKAIKLLIATPLLMSAGLFPIHNMLTHDRQFWIRGSTLIVGMIVIAYFIARQQLKDRAK